MHHNSSSTNRLYFKLFSFFLCIALPLFASAQQNSLFTNTRIQEAQFVLINGIEQWITIKGESTKPIVLFIHGGPGSPLSPYSDNLYKEWEKDFIIVQWDQRGAGKTYGRNAPTELTPEYLKANPLSLEQMTNDGIEVSEYLIKHLGKQKIILCGTSWGSVLGVKMATKRPDLYYAYIGHSQIVTPSIDEHLFNKVYKIAKDKNDTASLKVLNTIGKPPYARAKNLGQLFRILKKYEKANSTPAPASWFTISPAYDNPKDEQNRSDGDDYSFVNYAGDTLLAVPSMSATINLLKDNADFKIPVYIIQGNEDILTPKENSRLYFDKIKAPKKEYFLLPDASHGFNISVLEKQYEILMSIDAG